MTVSAEWYGDRGAGRRGAANGLFDAAQYLKDRSQQQVPIEEGILQSTATVSVDDARLEASVSYDTVYAARQHEELTWRHDEGRKAKYLEDPLHDEAKTLQAIVKTAIARELQ